MRRGRGTRAGNVRRSSIDADRASRAELAHTLLSVGRAAQAGGDAITRLTAICEAMVDIIGCDRSSVFVVDDDRLVPTANHGNPPDIAERFPTVRFSARHPLFERILDADEPVHVPDAAAAPELLSRELVVGARIHAIIGARLPTEIAPGAVITAEFNETAAEFDEFDTVVASGLAQIAALVLDERAAHQRELDLLAQIRWRSEHDDLTSLPNRRYLAWWFEQVPEHLGRDRRIAVLMADLDRFKVVNDALGHAAGDELLLVVARRLAAEFDDDSPSFPSTRVCRFGGDEFVIVAAVHDLAGAERIADRLSAALDAPVVLGSGHSIRVTASVGIAISTVAELKPDVLMSDADAAMYVAKAERRGRSVFARLDHRPTVSHRFDLEVSLDRALTDREIVPWFQPIVDTATGRWVAVEALARWVHPDRGILRPDEFLPSLIEMGLLRRLTCTIVEQSAEVLDDPVFAGLDLFVNLSAADLDSGLATRMQDAADPGRLVVELTERDAVSRPSDVVATLEEARAAGIRVALDDFGTGYSSLGVLADLPLDVLKLDRSLIEGVRNATAAEVFRATVRLGRALSLEVVAEGIEDASDLSELADADVRLAQGSLLCPPVAVADLRDLVARSAGGGSSPGRYHRPT